MDRTDCKMAIGGDITVLIVAGSDSSGGAGLVRDVETVSAFGVKSAAALTAITAQTHDRVIAVQALDPSLVESQMLAALAANDIRAIKIGMLATVQTVDAVAKVIAEHPDIPVVLDPVIASSSGTLLLDEDGIRILLQDLLPLCSLATPNLSELQRLSRMEGELDIRAMSENLIANGAKAVLAKGGHIESHDCADTLYRPGYLPRVFTSERFCGTLRGTGCMLASAIAANLAAGRGLDEAVHDAKRHVERQFLKSGAQQNKGN
jgi:hydroxymethylpyrimidine/phosphomethylpyrimidine kinase